MLSGGQGEERFLEASDSYTSWEKAEVFMRQMAAKA